MGQEDSSLVQKNVQRAVPAGNGVMPINGRALTFGTSTKPAILTEPDRSDSESSQASTQPSTPTQKATISPAWSAGFQEQEQEAIEQVPTVVQANPKPAGRPKVSITLCEVGSSPATSGNPHKNPIREWYSADDLAILFQVGELDEAKRTDENYQSWWIYAFSDQHLANAAVDIVATPPAGRQFINLSPQQAELDITEVSTHVQAVDAATMSNGQVIEFAKTLSYPRSSTDRYTFHLPQQLKTILLQHKQIKQEADAANVPHQVKLMQKLQNALTPEDGEKLPDWFTIRDFQVFCLLTQNAISEDMGKLTKIMDETHATRSVTLSGAPADAAGLIDDAIKQTADSIIDISDDAMNLPTIGKYINDDKINGVFDMAIAKATKSIHILDKTEAQIRAGNDAIRRFSNQLFDEESEYMKLLAKVHKKVTDGEMFEESKFKTFSENKMKKLNEQIEKHIQRNAELANKSRAQQYAKAAGKTLFKNLSWAGVKGIMANFVAEEVVAGLIPAISTAAKVGSAAGAPGGPAAIAAAAATAVAITIVSKLATHAIIYGLKRTKWGRTFLREARELSNKIHQKTHFYYEGSDSNFLLEALTPTTWVHGHYDWGLAISKAFVLAKRGERVLPDFLFTDDAGCQCLKCRGAGHQFKTLRVKQADQIHHCRACGKSFQYAHIIELPVKVCQECYKERARQMTLGGQQFRKADKDVTEQEREQRRIVAQENAQEEQRQLGGAAQFC